MPKKKTTRASKVSKKAPAKKLAPPKKNGATKKLAAEHLASALDVAGAEREYDRLVSIIDRTSAREMKDFDARWEAADALVSRELFRLKFKSVDDFYRTVMHEEPRNAQRFVRVARFATPMEEEFYGITKLDAAITFVEAKIGHKIEHPPIPVAFELLRIPVDGGTKLLKDATVADIHAATAKLGARGDKRPKNDVHAALERGLAKVSSLAKIVVHERSGLLSFQGIPIAAFTHFLKIATHVNAKRAT